MRDHLNMDKQGLPGIREEPLLWKTKLKKGTLRKQRQSWEEKNKITA